MPSQQEYLRRWSALHGGYDPAAGSFWVRGWLKLMYGLARPFAAARFSPDVVTLLGPLVVAGAVAAGAAGERWPLLAVVLVVLTGVVDGLDGAVAVLRDRVTVFGGVLDSVVDRVGDVLFLVLLAVLGAPVWLCVLGGTLTFLQEYVRARAAAVGMREIGVVTVCERPTRVVVVAMFTLGAGIYVSAAETWASAGAAAWATLSAVALVQVLIVARRALR